MKEYKHCIVIGITGGMGCGQTSVGGFMEKLSAKVINADEMAKKAIEINSDLQKELKLTFGKSIFYRDGKLNRKRLAGIVFQDESKLHRLNRMVHPRMVELIIEEIEEARGSGRYKIIALDAALIYEINIENMFEAIVVVASYMKNRIDRIAKRDGHSRKHISDRIHSQIPIEDKIKWTDYVVENNGTLEETKLATKKVYDELLKIVKTKRESRKRK